MIDTGEKESPVNVLPTIPVINPLTQEDLALLQEIVANAKTHRDLIARCQECGLSIDDKYARNEMHITVAQKIIDKFFPPKLAPDRFDI